MWNTMHGVYDSPVRPHQHEQQQQARFVHNLPLKIALYVLNRGGKNVEPPTIPTTLEGKVGASLKHFAGTRLRR